MKLDKSVQITIIIVLGILFLALIGYNLFSSFNPNDTITLTGKSTIKATPNLVVIYFNVETKGDTSEEATKENSDIVSLLRDKLIIEGFNKEDLKTQNFNVYPNYEWINNKRVEKGYVATHSLKLEMPTGDTEKIGSVIDAGVEAGAGISYINFELSQELQNQYKAEAIKLAAEDAKMKAEALVEGIGGELGRLVRVSDSSFDYYPVRAFGEVGEYSIDSDEAKSATQISPGEQEISGIVTAVYKIK
jgi:uncharacterized protein